MDSLGSVDLTGGELDSSLTGSVLPKTGESRIRSFQWSVIGFPFDAVHHQQFESTTRYQFEILPTCLDLVAFMLILSGTILLTYHYHSPRELRARATRIWLTILVVFTAGVGWHCWQSHLRFVELARFGKSASVQSINHALFDWLPQPLRDPWTHTYSFIQNSPDDRIANAITTSRLTTTDDLAACLAQHRQVHSIELHGVLSKAMQETLHASAGLRSLRWNRAPTVEAITETMAKLDQLNEIRISFAESKERSKEAVPEVANSSTDPQLDFRGMSQLETLSVSGVNQSELSNAAFSLPRLQKLSLEFAGYNGVPLIVERLPRLRELRIAASRSTRSSVEIEVRQMPELRLLTVPVFRPVHLTLEDVAMLKTINTTYGTRPDVEMQTADYAPWFRSLEIKNAPSLAELSLTVVSTERWSIQGCPRLRTLEITEPSVRRQEILRSVPSVQANRSLKPVWDWLQGELPLNEISIARMDLRNVNMSSWNRMKFLKQVQLRQCLTRPGQMKQLVGIPSLVQVDAAECKLDDFSAERLLTSRSDWELLLFDWSEVANVKIVNQPKLTKTFGNRTLRANRVHLENLPRFNEQLHLSGRLDELIIENTPMLSSLVVAGTFPESSSINAVSGLREFAVRRSTISPELSNALHQANNLQTLLLPSCRVSPTLLSNLQHWRHLIVLDLAELTVTEDFTSTRPINDADMKSLGALKSLLILKLDNSNVESETIRQISYCDRLQVLSLMNCRLTSKQLEPLARSEVLSELHVDASIALTGELEKVARDWGASEAHEFVTQLWEGTTFSSDQFRRPHRGRPRPMMRRLPLGRRLAVREQVEPGGAPTKIVPQ